MNTLPPLYKAALCLFALFVLCTATEVSAQDATPEVLYNSNFAVMPCRLGRARPNTPAEQKKIIDCTLADLCYLEGDPLQGAAEIITDLMQREMQKRFEARVASLDNVQNQFRLLSPKPDQTLREVAVALAKR